ncbi:hypothetical protein PHYSODRAFT_342063 [Phytophthora sojae]|uniref:FAD/NAD(P)-binding domain-containing protein n=1 Tax=Phytophthora sojae (strain P6497) TaxID=1094619 RepID=G5AF73_PHYSP|nr:hypothetical protein PHYSODRAFT_342063 [Phytophthora sojae]EGZ05863.1 hypothetical protein PHYSODRAFT_342063 [Phytophthora sojae]|eukprot:XP_009538724.1 hypothetical protein PHYSODRAFT_342063 [Phytophthora sojae]
MTRVVIIGGGAAGINTAQALAKNLTEADDTEVVVLEKNSFFYHVVGAPRAYVDADYTDKMFIPYDNAIPKHSAKFVRIVRGVATRISAETNQVSYHAIGSDDRQSEATETLQFDYLVLATGSSYSVPIKPDNRDFARLATEAKLQEEPPVAAMILPLGPCGGVSQLPVWGGVVFGDWVTWMIKSRDYFAGYIWSSIGATVPK